MGKEIVNHRSGVLTIVNVAKILIASEICIYLPSEHQHDEDGDVLKFMRCGGREDERKINGISHCTLRATRVILKYWLALVHDDDFEFDETTKIACQNIPQTREDCFRSFEESPRDSIINDLNVSASFESCFKVLASNWIMFQETISEMFFDDRISLEQAF